MNLREKIKEVNHGGIDADGSTDTDRLLRLFLATIKECVGEKKGHGYRTSYEAGWDDCIDQTLAKAEEVVAPPKQEGK